MRARGLSEERRDNDRPSRVRALLLRRPGQGSPEDTVFPGPGALQPGALSEPRQERSRHLAGARSQTGRQLCGATSLGEILRTPRCSRYRLRRSPRLGTPLESRRFHSGLESLLHALLGRHAYGAGSIPTPNWKEQFDRPRGTSTFATIRCVPRRDLLPISVSTWTRFFVGSLS